jgi:endothelin-converting enzyme
MLETGYPKESKVDSSFCDDAADGAQHSEFSPARLSQAERSVDEQNFNKMKTAYEACMDTEVLDMLAAEPLSRVLRHIASLFPVQLWATTDVVKSPDVRDVILNLARLGVTALVSPHAEPDSRDPDTVVVSIAAPSSVGLSTHEQYRDEGLVKKYHAVMSKVLSSLSRSERGDVNRIVELEKKLAGISRGNVTVSSSLPRIVSDLEGDL